MATREDLPDFVGAAADAIADLWAHVKDSEDTELKALVALVHHTSSDALDAACEVYNEERSFFLPPSRSGPDDKPEI